MRRRADLQRAHGPIVRVLPIAETDLALHAGSLPPSAAQCPARSRNGRSAGPAQVVARWNPHRMTVAITADVPPGFAMRDRRPARRQPTSPPAQQTGLRQRGAATPSSWLALRQTPSDVTGNGADLVQYTMHGGCARHRCPQRPQQGRFRTRRSARNRSTQHNRPGSYRVLAAPIANARNVSCQLPDPRVPSLIGRGRVTRNTPPSTPTSWPSTTTVSSVSMASRKGVRSPRGPPKALVAVRLP